MSVDEIQVPPSLCDRCEEVEDSHFCQCRADERTILSGGESSPIPVTENAQSPHGCDCSPRIELEGTFFPDSPGILVQKGDRSFKVEVTPDVLARWMREDDERERAKLAIRSGSLGDPVLPRAPSPSPEDSFATLESSIRNTPTEMEVSDGDTVIISDEVVPDVSGGEVVITTSEAKSDGMWLDLTPPTTPAAAPPDPGRAKVRSGPGALNPDPLNSLEPASVSPLTLSSHSISVGTTLYENLNQFHMAFVNCGRETFPRNGWSVKLDYNGATGKGHWSIIRRARPTLARVKKRLRRHRTLLTLFRSPLSPPDDSSKAVESDDPYSPRLPIVYLYNILDNERKAKPKGVPTLEPVPPYSLWYAVEDKYGKCFLCGNPVVPNRWCHRCATKTSQTERVGAIHNIKMNSQLTGESLLVWEMVSPNSTWVKWYKMYLPKLSDGIFATHLKNRYVEMWFFVDPYEGTMVVGSQLLKQRRGSHRHVHSTYLKATRYVFVQRAEAMLPIFKKNDFRDAVLAGIVARKNDMEVWSRKLEILGGKTLFPRKILEQAARIIRQAKTNKAQPGKSSC